MDERVDGEERLAWQLGLLLQTARARSGISQAQLAERAGLPKQQVSRFEQGRRAVTSTLVDRLFGELGLRVRVEVEAAGAGLGAEIEKVRADLAVRQNMLFANLRLLNARHQPRFGHLLDGEGAALLQGVPVAARRIDLLVAEAEVDALAEWITSVGLRRYDERWGELGWSDPDPRLPGPLRWGNGLVEVAVRLVGELPPPVLVTIPGFGAGEEHRAAVRALPEVEADFPAVARVLRRLRTGR
ncbi:helix-turn-helix transcriptional regulator [Catellatospora sp. NPDC049609]|uniref:helix-turn-helix domain-containing protein n=1 Tax=Catellatospora sp. NPDC049609 TaxID=3155505 RepID=UPI003434B7C6